MSGLQMVILIIFSFIGIGLTFMPIYTMWVVAKMMSRFMSFYVEEDTEYFRKSYALLLSNRKLFGDEHKIEVIIIRIIGLTILVMIIFLIVALIG